MMKKDVFIRVKSLIEADGETDKLDITTRGKMMQKDGSVFLTYKETDQNGFDGCSVLIRADGEERVTISRSGDLKSQLLIEKNKRNLCSYSTPYGSTMLGITCVGIKAKHKENPLYELSVCYELDVNSSLISKNQLFIKIKEC